MSEQEQQMDFVLGSLRALNQQARVMVLQTEALIKLYSTPAPEPEPARPPATFGS